MNCLHISFNEYPSLTIEHSTKQIWKELMQDFDQYHILARSTDQKFHVECEGKLYLHRIPFGKGNKTFALQQFLLPYYVKKYNISIMIAQCSLLGGFAGILCSRIFKIPILVEIHGKHYFDIMDSNKYRNKVLAKVIRWVYNNATAVRALNPLMKEMLEQRGITSNIVVVQNRADFNLFKPQKQRYAFSHKIILIAVGSFVPLKGHLILIELVKKIKKEYANLELILVGGGPLLSEYKVRTQNDTCFHFFERLPQQEIVKLLKDADIFIQPSYSEAVPRSIIEAMAMGLPIVCSDAGMTTGLIQDGYNGLVFPVGDKAILEKKLRMMLENEQLRKALGTNAYNDALENYEWNKNFDKYRKVLRGLVYD